MNDVTSTYNFMSWLRKERSSQNLTLRELSRRTGISHTTIMEAENGKYSYETVRRLADYFRQPEQKILSLAGMLELKARDQLIDEIVHITQEMDAEQKQTALTLLRALLDKGTDHDKTAKRKVKRS